MGNWRNLLLETWTTIINISGDVSRDAWAMIMLKNNGALSLRLILRNFIKKYVSGETKFEYTHK